MPRDAESRRRARRTARIVLFLMGVAVVGLAPLVNAFGEESGPAELQPPSCVSPRPSFTPPVGACSPTPTPSSPTPTKSSNSSSSVSASSSSGTSTSHSSSSSPTPSHGEGPTTATTDVTIKFDQKKSRFSGTVRSSVAACEKDRKIRLKRVVPGKDDSAGKDASAVDGSWSVKVRGAHGIYYAIAKSMTLFTAGGDEVDCLKGRSKNRQV